MIRPPSKQFGQGFASRLLLDSIRRLNPTAVVRRLNSSAQFSLSLCLSGILVYLKRRNKFLSQVGFQYVCFLLDLLQLLYMVDVPLHLSLHGSYFVYPALQLLLEPGLGKVIVFGLGRVSPKFLLLPEDF